MVKDNHVHIVNSQICLPICTGLSSFLFYLLVYAVKVDTDKIVQSESTLPSGHLVPK